MIAAGGEGNVRSRGRMIGRMRSLAAVLAVPALVLLAPGVSVAAAAQCQGSPEISYDIDLDIDIPEARVHHDRGIAELGRMAVHGPRGKILGLAKTGLDFGWRVEFAWRPEGAAFCFWVRRAELTIHRPSPDIYVAREYRHGTCPYRAVLAHERRHVRASRALIDRYIPRLRRMLTSPRIPTGQRPVLVGSPGAAESEVRALMKDLAEPLFHEMAEALGAAQAKIDSPASYKRLFKRCRRW